MSLDFTALDFETANAFRGSPCSVGMVKVRNGEVVAEYSTLVQPPVAFSKFDGFNTVLHGIDADMVANSPTWAQTCDRIVEWVGGDIVVCHNASFDIGVIRYACMADALPWPTLRFFCTLVAARRTYRLLSYRLPFVCAECGVTLLKHHRANDDADAAARIAVAMARLEDADSLEELAESLGMRIGRMQEGSYHGSLAGLTHGGGKLIRMEANAQADPEHVFFGQKVAFTGTLLSMRRQDAWDAVSRCGGTPTQNVSKITRFLVSGDINPAVLAPGKEMTGKAAKAALLMEKGARIELLAEDDFIRSI